MKELKNDSDVNKLFDGLDDLVRESAAKTAEDTITFTASITPSKSTTGAPYSENKALDNWRIGDGDIVDEKNLTSSSTYSNSKNAAKEAYDQVMAGEKEITVYNQAEYAELLEYGLSTTGGRMVATTDGSFIGIANKAFNETMKRS
ncbi:hypothetical protein [Endozoicomonas sp. ALB115]|uniref:hypothetical protein n=1 Tax=Endozoicomonas sp. ALB115 TaxID=3403074 RepID=UPI003BB52348